MAIVAAAICEEVVAYCFEAFVVAKALALVLVITFHLDYCMHV